MNMHYLQIVTLFTLIMLSVDTSAEVYKWVDSSGAVHFSDKPTGTNPTEVAVKSKRTDYAAMAIAKQEKLDQEQADAADAAVRQEIEEENQANRKIRIENCRRATESLRSVENARRLYVPDEQGERRYLSEVEIAQRLSQAKKDVDDWCSKT